MQIDLPFENIEKSKEEIDQIINSKKYQNLLAFFGESEKYINVISLISLMAFIKSEQGDKEKVEKWYEEASEYYKKSLEDFRKVYSYRKGVQDGKYTVQAMRNISYTSAKLGSLYTKIYLERHELTDEDSNNALEYYHEGLFLNCKIYQIQNEMSFSSATTKENFNKICVSLHKIAWHNSIIGEKTKNKKFYENAESIYEIVLAKQKAVFKKHDEFIISTKCDLAFTKIKFGDYYLFSKNHDLKKAFEKYHYALKLNEEAYESRKNNLGENDNRTLKTRMHVAYTHKKLTNRNFEHDIRLHNLEIGLKIYKDLAEKDWEGNVEATKNHEELKKLYIDLNWRHKSS